MSAHLQPVSWHTHTAYTHRRKWAQIKKAFPTQFTPISKTKTSFKCAGGVNSEADHYLLFLKSFVPKQETLIWWRWCPCVITLLPLHQGYECFAKINMIMVMKTLCACSEKNGSAKDRFLLFPIQQWNNHHHRRSIENSWYFKLCYSSKSNTKVHASHIARKHAQRLENILTHNRSQIKNDNPLNGPHFSGCER